jgi:hypothetical protein
MFGKQFRLRGAGDCRERSTRTSKRAKLLTHQDLELLLINFSDANCSNPFADPFQRTPADFLLFAVLRRSREAIKFLQEQKRVAAVSGVEIGREGEQFRDLNCAGQRGIAWLSQS